MMNFHLNVLGIFISLGLVVNGLRFAQDAITADTDIIVVGRPTTLTCNYVKMRAETIREITWFAGYSGFNSRIFHYSIKSGEKTGSVLPFLKTDKETATDSELTITLTDFRAPLMTFSCEVEALRDDGYGKLRHSKKLAKSKITVIDSRNHEIIVRPDSDKGHKVGPGQAYSLTCLSRGIDPSPKLQIQINGRNISEHYGGSISQMTPGSSGETYVIGKLKSIPESMFKDGFLNFNCKAYFDEYLFAEKSLKVQRDKFGNPIRPTSNRRNWNDNEDYSRNYEETNYKRNPYEQKSSSHSRGHGRQGRIENSDSDLIHSRLMDLVDPARHVHPGIPYDFFAGYLIMLSEEISDNGSVVLYGELPYDVESSFKRNYARFNKISSSMARIRMDPAKTLNTLGSLGYRVNSSAKYGSNGFMWTLERKNFDTSNNENASREY